MSSGTNWNDQETITMFSGANQRLFPKTMLIGKLLEKFYKLYPRVLSGFIFLPAPPEPQDSKTPDWV